MLTLEYMYILMATFEKAQMVSQKSKYDKNIYIFRELYNFNFPTEVRKIVTC